MQKKSNAGELREIAKELHQILKETVEVLTPAAGKVPAQPATSERSPGGTAD